MFLKTIGPSPASRCACAALALLATTACDKSGGDGDKPAATLAPAATALAPAKPPAAGSVKLAIDKAATKVDFLMEAPQEKIVGHVPGTAAGELHIDVADITKSTGTITVDLSSLEVVQAKVDDTGKLGPEQKVDKQNEHARTWLEISPDTPEEMRKKNAVVSFSITSIETTGEKALSKLTGPERKMTLKVTGDFLLHGHKAPKTTEIAATFKLDGDKLVSATFKSSQPFGVDLAEHDVKPRDAFGKLALKTLETLSPKVAKQAMVSLDVTAHLVGEPSRGSPNPSTP